MANRQRGFTLIEALVALVVLSIGLLGVAAMQLKALQSAHMGYQRSVASLAAIDAQERTWAVLPDEGCPDSSLLSDISGAWASQWFGSDKMLLDAGSSGIFDNGSCSYRVVVNWREGRGSADDGEFTYEFRMPEVP